MVKSEFLPIKILNIDTENNLIILKGAVPGHKGSIIKIVDAVKKNQKISLNENINNNISEDSLPKESKDTNTNASDNVIENKSDVSKNVAASTEEKSENKNIQKEVGEAGVKEVEQNNQLTSDSKQTEKS